MMNRRQLSLINKPLSEIDLTKSQRICTSYSELPKTYPNLICSGRSEEISKLMNDRFISIPAGSEDDKNPLKKNHYEEHIFKFEDQRYEIDMIIEILKFAVEELTILNEKVIHENLETNDLDNILGSSTTRFISFFYKDYTSQVLEGFKFHPKESLPIVINRFKKRIEEALNQKIELEKNLKLTFDRFYYKSFDHRSFKLKNFEKKSNNAKAFVKEMSTRKKEKLNTNSINQLKGGIDNFDFFYSIKLKFAKENIGKLLKYCNDQILLKNLEIPQCDQELRKKLPEMKIVFENMDILKITIALIYYQIYYSNIGDSQKIADTLMQVLENVFRLGVSQLVQHIFSQFSSVSNDKDHDYLDTIEKIKNKNADQKEIEKFYNMDNLVKNIYEYESNLDNEYEVENINKNITRKDYSPDNHSEISLTPSLQSQDTGKTYKDIIIFNENGSGGIKRRSSLFIPLKDVDHVLFYANENFFVLIRFIYCIYERINKLYEYSATCSNENNLYNNKNLNFVSLNNSNSNESSFAFKNFIIIYKALIHKKIENNSIYEELCREILGNESYFLFNLDKLVNSLIKTISSVNNDTNSKDILNLFFHEKNRKNSVCESLYFSNFIKLSDFSSTSCFRILYSPSINVMTFHLCEFSNEYKKDFLGSFKEYVEESLQESYQKLEKENLSQDESLTIFLERNKNLMKKRRSNIMPDYFENNLLSKFDFNSKKLQFIKSGCDNLVFNKKPINIKERAKKSLLRNLSLRIWSDNKIYSK